MIEVTSMATCGKCGKVWTQLYGGWAFIGTRGGKDIVALDNPCSEGGKCEASRIIMNAKDFIGESIALQAQVYAPAIDEKDESLTNNWEPMVGATELQKLEADNAHQSRVIEAQREVIEALEAYIIARALGDDGEIDEAANNIDFARARLEKLGVNV